MLIIICAEIEEAKHIKCPHAKILITGPGICNVLQTPKFDVGPHDRIINVGYAGSNKYDIGSVIGVDLLERLTPSKTIADERMLYLSSLCKSDKCYTADNFVEGLDMEIPLVDMELYYLASIYQKIQSIKIVSDNLNYSEYKRADFKDSWEEVNRILNATY